MVTTKLMTADDLFLMPEDDARYELIRGELIKMPPPDRIHGRRLLRVGSFFLSYADEVGGEATAEAGFRLEVEPDTVLGPDITYTNSARVPLDDARGYVSYAPDVAVEIDSPSNRPGERLARVEIYHGAGTRLVLFVNDEKRTVTAHYADGRVIVLTINDVLDGEDIMPGFRLPIADLFR